MYSSVCRHAGGNVVGSCGVDLPTGVFPALGLVGWELLNVVVGVLVDICYQAGSGDGVVLVRWKDDLIWFGPSGMRS